MNNDRKRVVIYARVSSEEQAKHGFSIENQKRTCVEYAEKNGYSIAKVFVDEGKSAKSLDRPEIQELITYCSKKTNKVFAIIIWRLDRLSRNNTDYHGVLRPMMESKGIKLLSATEANVETIEGNLLRNIGMSFAEYERQVIGYRTSAGLQQKANQGEYPHAVPLGYKNIYTTTGHKDIVIDESKSIYIKRAFELYDSGLYSLRRLVEELYNDGFRNSKGAKVTKTTLSYILKNIFYTGVFAYKGKVYENAKHEAIISKELYYRVQDKLTSPEKSKTRDLNFTYSGIIKCAKCGCLLTAELKKNKYIYYHCTGNKGGQCKSDWLKEEKIDKSIAQVLKLIIIPDDIRNDIYNAIKSLHEKKNGYSREVKTKLQAQISKLENRIEGAFQEKLDGNISHEQWKTYNEKWQLEKDKLYIQLQNMNELDKEFYRRADDLLEFTNNAYQYYMTGTLLKKRKVVSIITESMTYEDKELNIILKPVFQTIVENQYKIIHDSNNNRTLETGIKKEFEPNSNSNVLKNSPYCTTLELFVNRLYNNIMDVKFFNLYYEMSDLKEIA